MKTGILIILISLATGCTTDIREICQQEKRAGQIVILEQVPCPVYDSSVYENGEGQEVDR